jgi:hypothetical protein
MRNRERKTSRILTTLSAHSTKMMAERHHL